MKKNLKLSVKYIKLIFQASIVLLCMGTIVYFMPRNNVFNYNYSEAAPWNYGQIIAPFNFPIYKSEQQIAHEKDSITNHFVMYFSKDSTAALKALRQLKSRFYSNASEEIPQESYIKYYNTLIKLYNNGIVSEKDKERISTNKAQNVNIINNHISTSCSKNKFNELQENYSYA